MHLSDSWLVRLILESVGPLARRRPTLRNRKFSPISQHKMPNLCTEYRATVGVVWTLTLKMSRAEMARGDPLGGRKACGR
jgi:hypothetical protein